MSSVNEGKAISSLHTLRRKVVVEALARVQPVLLLQILIGVSQTLNGGEGQPEALARALILDGQQRLSKVLASAPRLHLPLERMLEIVRSIDAHARERTPEESAVQALLEMCLGLMLQWLARSGRSHIPALSARRQSELPGILHLSSFPFLLSYPPPRRTCSIVPFS